MAALAICAVACAQLRRRTDTQAPPPTTPEQAPPADPGTIPLTVPETRRLLAQALARPKPPSLNTHWRNWRRRHQARSRWFHQRTRLGREYALVRQSLAAAVLVLLHRLRRSVVVNRVLQLGPDEVLNLLPGLRKVPPRGVAHWTEAPRSSRHSSTSETGAIDILVFGELGQPPPLSRLGSEHRFDGEQVAGRSARSAGRRGSTLPTAHASLPGSAVRLGEPQQRDGLRRIGALVRHVGLMVASAATCLPGGDPGHLRRVAIGGRVQRAAGSWVGVVAPAPSQQVRSVRCPPTGVPAHPVRPRYPSRPEPSPPC